MPFQVIQEVKHWSNGKSVPTSVSAEKGRQDGCLCVHTDPKTGENVMCARLAANMRLQERLHEKECDKEGHEGLVRDTARNAVEILGAALYVGAELDWEHSSVSDGCPIAWMLYAVAQTGGAEFGTAACKGYVPQEKSAQAAQE